MESTKRYFKIFFSLLLLTIFIILCFVIFAAASFGAWLHTYRTFTQKRLVAIVEVGPVQKDGELTYSEVTYRPVKDRSALVAILSPSKDDEMKDLGDSQTFKVYGDQVEVGGQVVRFNDIWHLFNLKNVYKVTRLEGDFSDAEISKNLTQDKRSIYDLNGGAEDFWKTLQKNESSYSFLVDTVYGSQASKYMQSQDQKFGLYITEDGFMLDKIEE